MALKSPSIHGGFGLVGSDMAVKGDPFQRHSTEKFKSLKYNRYDESKKIAKKSPIIQSIIKKHKHVLKFFEKADGDQKEEKTSNESEEFSIEDQEFDDPQIDVLLKLYSASVLEEKAEIEKLEVIFKKQVSDIQEESQLNISMIESLQNSDGEYSDDFNKFQYNYLNSRVSNDTFNKVFEMRGDEENLFVFTHNNKNINSDNYENPYYGEVTLTQF